jgi:predicted amidohydrolase
LDIAWEDKAANFQKVSALLEAHPPPPNSLLVLPEMYSTGFTMNTAVTAEAPNGPSEQFLCDMARRFNVHVLGGVVSLRENKARNDAVAFSPSGEMVTRYSKLQPFTHGGEAAAHACGTGPTMFEWHGVKVSPFICYDLRFPEWFRAAAKSYRPHLIVVIANWPSGRVHHWLRLLQARAIENQAYVLGVNRCGKDPTLNYNGQSCFIDCHGDILVTAGESEHIFQGEIDLEKLEDYRSKFRFLDDQR